MQTIHTVGELIMKLIVQQNVALDKISLFITNKFMCFEI